MKSKYCDKERMSLVYTLNIIQDEGETKIIIESTDLDFVVSELKRYAKEIEPYKFGSVVFTIEYK